MGDDHVAAFEVDQKVFRPPPERQDAPAGNERGEIGREGKAQVRTAQLRPHQERAFHRGRQAPPDGFHLGKFRHSRLLACAK